MLSLKEAIEIAESKSNSEVATKRETDDRYIFGMYDGSTSSYTTVDKESGELSIMWMMEFLDLLEEGKIHSLDY